MSVSGFDGMTATGKERRPGGHDPIASLWVQAAHDLRQPVQAAQLLAGALDDVAERDRLKRAARGIEAALQSLHEMLETVALLARLEGGLQTIALRPFELADLEPTLRELAAMAAARAIPLRLEELQGAVRSDPKLLPVLVRSLFLNALRFGDGRGLAVSCRHGRGQLGIEVEFRGTAQGAGIERHAFIQLAAPGDPLATGELGLGLMLLRRLCDLLGHRLQHTVSGTDRQLLVLIFSADDPVAGAGAGTHRLSG
jgi:signal transduction histidine kinase